jgi:rhamnogalacturonan hydrolase
MWTDTGNQVQYTCQNAYGSGACLKSGSGGTYATVKKSVTAAPANYKAPRLEWDLRQSTGTKDPIRIPDWPASFFPGKRPIKPLAAARAGSRLVELFNGTEPTYY